MILGFHTLNAPFRLCPSKPLFLSIGWTKNRFIKEKLSYIVQSAKALLDQLNEIFEFIEVESGQLPILDKPFDIHQILQDVTSMMILPAKNKHLHFSFQIEPAILNCRR